MLDKIKEPPKSDDHPMVRGDRIHKLAEAYLKSATGTANTKPPEELKAFGNLFKRLRKARRVDPETVVVEETWAFRKDWTITTYDDWDACWLRVKLDVAEVDDCTVKPYDVKTGKYSPQYNLDDYVEQLDLYATAGLMMYADVGLELKVIPSLLYTDAAYQYPPPGTETVYTPTCSPRLRRSGRKP